MSYCQQLSRSNTHTQFSVHALVVQVNSACGNPLPPLPYGSACVTSLCLVIIAFREFENWRTNHYLDACIGNCKVTGGIKIQSPFWQCPTLSAKPGATTLPHFPIFQAESNSFVSQDTKWLVLLL
jgi:hypothetical protein